MLNARPNSAALAQEVTLRATARSTERRKRICPDLINARPSNLLLVLEKGVPQLKIVRLEPKAAGRLTVKRNARTSSLILVCGPQLKMVRLEPKITGKVA